MLPFLEKHGVAKATVSKCLGLVALTRTADIARPEAMIQTSTTDGVPDCSVQTYSAFINLDAAASANYQNSPFPLQVSADGYTSVNNAFPNPPIPAQNWQVVNKWNSIHCLGIPTQLVPDYYCPQGGWWRNLGAGFVPDITPGNMTLGIIINLVGVTVPAVATSFQNWAGQRPYTGTSGLIIPALRHSPDRFIAVLTGACVQTCEVISALDANFPQTLIEIGPVLACTVSQMLKVFNMPQGALVANGPYTVNAYNQIYQCEIGPAIMAQLGVNCLLVKQAGNWDGFFNGAALLPGAALAGGNLHCTTFEPFFDKYSTYYAWATGQKIHDQKRPDFAVPDNWQTIALENLAKRGFDAVGDETPDSFQTISSMLHHYIWNTPAGVLQPSLPLPNMVEKLTGAIGVYIQQYCMHFTYFGLVSVQNIGVGNRYWPNYVAAGLGATTANVAYAMHSSNRISLTGMSMLLNLGLNTREVALQQGSSVVAPYHTVVSSLPVARAVIDVRGGAVGAALDGLIKAFRARGSTAAGVEA